ncbi:hypothetical protein DXG01_010717, partial [Tephrocybe rancida]
MVMVSEKLPVLSLAIPAFKKFMSQLKKLIKEQPRLVPIISPALTKAIKYYKKMDDTTAYLRWDEEFVAAAKKTILNLMREYQDNNLVVDLPTPHPAPAAAVRYALGSSSSDESDSEDDNIYAAHSTVKAFTVEQEYSKYVLGSLFPIKTKLLHFWE